MVRSIVLNSATQQFIEAHAFDDVRQLALQGSKDTQVEMPFALQQIQGRQAARHKLPSWAAIDGIIYPPHLNMEQCSSEQTARYKAKIIDDLPLDCSANTGDEHQQDSPIVNRQLLDLTGGFGVDFAFMSKGFEQAIYVEQNPDLCDIASANFATLGLTNVETICGDGIDYLHHFDGRATLIFIDPARRDSHGQRTFGIGDCTPDVLPLMDELFAKADHVLLKLSPMLDWRKAVCDVNCQHVEQVHIVSVDNECKELLLLLSKQGSKGSIPLICANNTTSCEPSPSPCAEMVTFTIPDSLDSKPIYTPTFTGEARGGSVREKVVRVGSSFSFLYEPNASLMKAGLFTELAERYGVYPLGPNSHLFTSTELVNDFPGRTFRVVAMSSMNKKELREKVLPLGQANISVRNFPMTTDQLRHKLKLSEGGSNYLFATTLASGQRVLLLCRKPV